jgi:hypothetical protein
MNSKMNHYHFINIDLLIIMLCLYNRLSLNCENNFTLAVSQEANCNNTVPRVRVTPHSATVIATPLSPLHQNGEGEDEENDFAPFLHSVERGLGWSLSLPKCERRSANSRNIVNIRSII